MGTAGTDGDRVGNPMKYPDAVWRPGPQVKRGYSGSYLRHGDGAVLHSMEGGLAGALGRLDFTYDPFNAYSWASWHFSNPKAGPLLQHYDTDDITWHAGATANRLYVGIEHEGVAGEPLTGNQVVNVVNLLQWLGKMEAWPNFKRQVTLWEHNEFMATACPSGRIPWDIIIRGLTVSEYQLNVQESASVLYQTALKLTKGDAQGAVDVLKYIYWAKGWQWK